MTDDRQYRLGSAALWLARDLAACQVLTAGEPVARSRLHGDRLLAIGEPIKGEPLVMDERLALRVEGVRLDEQNGESGESAPLPEQPVLRIVTAETFAAVEEEGAEAIVGTPEDTVVSGGSDAMFYGDGGAGKTTMAIDLGCHLAAGDDWLGISVAKPVRVLLIENEGPRPRFRAKVRRKLAAWSGSPLGDRLLVLEDPWGGFTYADPGWRQTLAEVVREQEVDVVIVGPLTASGMEAAGTLQETREFLRLVEQVRTLAGRPFASILIHHENRGGKVSGAWEATGDTLLHLQQLTHGRHRLTFQKTRWSSELHGTHVQLVWAPGEGFALAETEPPRPERVWDEIDGYVLAHGGCVWGDVERAVPGEATYLRRRRDQMLEDGLLINAGRVGPSGSGTATTRAARRSMCSSVGPPTELRRNPRRTRGRTRHWQFRRSVGPLGPTDLGPTELPVLPPATLNPTTPPRRRQRGADR